LKTLDSNDAELPTWSVGDSWTYDVSIKGKNNDGSITFYLTFDNLLFKVTESNVNDYKLSVTGSLVGSGSFLGLISGSIQNGNLAGNLYVNKSDLRVIGFDSATMTGKVSIFNIDVDFNLIGFNPFYLPFNFPMNVGDSWGIPTTVMTVSGHINSPAIIPEDSRDIYMDLHANGFTSNCQKKEIKNGYQSLKIKGAKTECWYSFEAGNVVYAENTGNIKLLLWGLEDYYYEITSFDMELVDTTFTGPSNDLPNTPNTPTGDTELVEGGSGSFSTSGTDPDDYFVKYGFDWGDDSGVSWTDFVESGESASKGHTYTSEGTYEIKAKTKDYRGLESGWSDTLTVTVLPNDPPNKPTITGPAAGREDEVLTFTGVTTDPDDDKIYYKFDWDTSQSQWIGPKDSGEEATADKSWPNEGTYAIRVQAKDEHGALSEWSDPLSVNIPRSRLFPFKLLNFLESLKQRYTGLNLIIEKLLI